MHYAPFEKAIAPQLKWKNLELASRRLYSMRRRKGDLKISDMRIFWLTICYSIRY